MQNCICPALEYIVLDIGKIEHVVAKTTLIVITLDNKTNNLNSFMRENSKSFNDTVRQSGLLGPMQCANND